MTLRRTFAVLILASVLGASPAAGQDPPTEKVPPELLGEFTFIGDGVITFYLEGDLILGQVTTVPASDGIRLVGGADVSPCGFVDGKEFPFVLDEFGVGEWFFFDVDNAGTCVLLPGAPVTVDFTGIGATAFGKVPEGHRDFTDIPTGHTMLRIDPVAVSPTTTVATTTSTTTTTTLRALTDAEAREILGENTPSGWGDYQYRIALGMTAGIAGLLILWWRRGWRLPWQRPSDPGPVRQPREPEERRETCNCHAEISIEGAHTILTCCRRPIAVLNDCCDAKGVRDPLRTHLDLDVRGEDGRDYFDLIYQARITPGECDGGGRLRMEDLTSRWYLDDHGPDGLGISIEVTIPVDCPHGPQEPLHLFAHERIAYQDGKCLVGVMIKQVDTLDVSHVETHVICGNYSETFGYFPKGDRTFLNTVPGTEGKVGRLRENTPRIHPNGMTISAISRLAGDYRGSPEHRAADWDIWWFTFDDCTTCDTLRDYWEALAANPGEYYLTGRNCASTAAEALKEVGILPAGFITWTTVTPREVALSLENEHERYSVQKIRR
ncbi:MAG: hypothetical protein R2707_07490 [Acidimicrobiales bacterium]